jgi:aminopeptidase N
MQDANATDTTGPAIVRRADYLPPDFLIDTVDLHFELDPASTLVRSRLTVRRNPAGADPNEALHLDGEALELVSVRLDGAALGANRYSLRLDGALVIPGMPDQAVLEIETRIAPAANSELSGMYVSGGAFFTQCEAQGFRRITYFPDRPDVMARYTTTVVADRAAVPVLLSNGNLDASGVLEGGRHFARWVDPHPKPSYLFALVAGDLVAVRDQFTTRSGRPVELAIWVRRGDEDRCAHAMRSLKTSMSWEEEVYGLEYDLDVFNIAAVSDFNMGAMENKGLNVFNTKYVLARPDTATDGDYEGIESVIAHEYFHNWTGNRVTCRDWFQLSLKEGLTVFRDQQFSADQGSAAVKRISDVQRLRSGQFPEDAGPLAHPVRPDSYMAIDNFYTATVYQKGAEVVRMLHTLLGPVGFRKGMDLYIARHDNNAVTIEDFVRALQDGAGVDLSGFVAWYAQAGTPDVTVSDAYDAATRRYTLTLRQETRPTLGQPEKQPLPIPVAMALLGPDGRELPTMLNSVGQRPGTRLLMLDQATQDFVFTDVPAPPVPSLLRGYSAPVKLLGVARERLRFLAAHDSDPFVRWDSGQQYATDTMLDMVAAWRHDGTLAMDEGLLEAMAATLDGADADPAFAAVALTLPYVDFVADQMTVMDVEAIHAVRDFLREELGRRLGPALRATYDRLTDHGPYAIDGKAMGRRHLRNVCLSYLIAAGAEGVALAAAQFAGSGNMTDVLAALACLASTDTPERVAALSAFHARWHGDDLVLDKWFQIQAMSTLPRTLAAVRDLASHADFDLRSPNRVRALVGAFASGNPVRFHDASGEGYRFLADMILALDPMNGQVAARLVNPLGGWRRQDAARAALMRGELERIAAQPKLSRFTFEKASKALGVLGG